MSRLFVCLGACLGLVAAAPSPVLLAGFTRDAYGMCHKPGGTYVPCSVAAPPPTMQCKDGSYSSSKIVKTGCAGHGGVQKVL